jgi:hypothetical protein
MARYRKCLRCRYLFMWYSFRLISLNISFASVNGHVSGTSGSRYSDYARRCDNVIPKLLAYIDFDSEMKTCPYSVTAGPDEVTMRANRSDAVSPNLSPTSVTTFTSCLNLWAGVRWYCSVVTGACCSGVCVLSYQSPIFLGTATSCSNWWEAS